MQCCAGIIVCTQDYVYTGRTFRGRSVLVLYTYCCTTVVWCCMCSGLCVHGPKIQEAAVGKGKTALVVSQNQPRSDVSCTFVKDSSPAF